MNGDIPFIENLLLTENNAFMSNTFYAGAGSKLAAGLQISNSSVIGDYFDNRKTTTGDAKLTKLNITSATFDPSVEKGSEETLLQSKIKNGSYLLSIGMEGSFDANLRPEMTDWVFKATTQNTTVDTSTADYVRAGYTFKAYTLRAAGNDPIGSTLVLTKGDQVTSYPGMTVRSLSLNAPNNDFVTVSCDLVGREEIKAGASSAIPAGAVPETHYIPLADNADDFDMASYIVTKGIFKWNGNEWCIESSTLNIDNGIEDSPRCYQDGKYANIPVMGMRAVTFDFNTPYDSKIEVLKENYLLTSEYGSADLEFSTPEAEPDSIIRIIIPNLSITSVGAGISGTGVIDASVSGEAVYANSEEPITIIVYEKSSQQIGG